MSARERQRPIWVIDCDHKHCPEVFVADNTLRQQTDSGARWGASEAGWQVRTGRGPGSRSAPDFCPKHRTDGVS